MSNDYAEQTGEIQKKYPPRIGYSPSTFRKPIRDRDDLLWGRRLLSKRIDLETELRLEKERELRLKFLTRRATIKDNLTTKPTRLTPFSWETYSTQCQTSERNYAKHS